MRPYFSFVFLCVHVVVLVFILSVCVVHSWTHTVCMCKFMHMSGGGGIEKLIFSHSNIYRHIC